MKNELGTFGTDRKCHRKYTPIFKEEKWLDNQEVCLMMNITKRTLQTYKDKGLLPYSKLNRKNYYKRSDVQALLEAGQPYNTTKMDLFTNDNEEIIAHQEMIMQLRNRIESILKNYRPVMNGEIYLSGEDV
jgi:DNA-binding transcriptional MerR regulator